MNCKYQRNCESHLFTRIATAEFCLGQFKDFWSYFTELLKAPTSTSPGNQHEHWLGGLYVCPLPRSILSIHSRNYNKGKESQPLNHSSEFLSEELGIPRTRSITVGFPTRRRRWRCLLTLEYCTRRQPLFWVHPYPLKPQSRVTNNSSRGSQTILLLRSHKYSLGLGEPCHS